MTDLHLPLSFDHRADTTRPAPEKLIHGDPVHTTWLHEDRAPLYAGIWRSTPGAWRVAYDEWEYFNVLSGRGTLTDAQGRKTDLTPGTRHILRPGFTGIFEVTEELTKDFVILL